MSSSPTINISSLAVKYDITYNGTTIETTVTDYGDVAAEWVKEITALHGADPTVVGLHVECRPHSIRIMRNKTATLQLCVDKKCLILQLLYMDKIPEALNKAFLLNPNFTFVGVEDFSKLKREYDLACTKSVDIFVEANKRLPGRFQRPGLMDLALEFCAGVQRPGLRNIAFELCSFDMSNIEDCRKTNWEERMLSDKQVICACIEAYACYMIGHMLPQLDFHISLLNLISSLET